MCCFQLLIKVCACVVPGVEYRWRLCVLFQVLIIGGGDGGVSREVVKHPKVKEVVQCEIDEVNTSVDLVNVSVEQRINQSINRCINRTFDKTVFSNQ